MANDRKFIVDQDLSYKEFCLLVLRMILSVRALRRIFIIILLPFFFGLLLIPMIGLADEIWLTLLFPGGLCLLFFVGTLVASFFVPDSGKQARYIIDEWGVTCIRGGKEFKKPWLELDSWKETKNYFLIYVSEYASHALQKRIMIEDNINFDEFRDLLASNLPPK